jgi:RNA polymerase sigma-70 factor (ECF subfamily)
LTTDDNFKDHLLSKKLQGIVEMLPQPQQQVVKAIYFQEMTHEQLADQLNIPVGTVKSRLRLALNRLKQHIGSQHD